MEDQITESIATQVQEETMIQEFEKEIPNEQVIKYLDVIEFKLDNQKQQLNILVQCSENDKTFDKWILSNELIELQPVLLTNLLITKTKFGLAQVDPDEEVMKDFRKI